MTMKLRFVKFATQVDVPGIGPCIEFSSAAVAIEYDRPSDMVRIGNDGVEVPRSEVRVWHRERGKEPPQVKVKCEVCSKEYNNRQALGGHRRQTGHGA